MKYSHDQPAKIALMNGDTSWGYSITVHKDSTYWHSASDASLVAVPTANVRHIELSTPHATVGMILGVLCGSVVGGIAAIGMQGGIWGSSGQASLTSGVFATAACSVWGAYFGYSKGKEHTTTYRQYP